jgi:Mg2+ and Co2+ transporter CorA
MEDDRNAPATKGDLADQETRIVDRLTEAIRDAQTEVLKAFYGFAESNRQRLAQPEGNQGAIIARIGVLEDRMLELERKINFPQQPPQ